MSEDKLYSAQCTLGKEWALRAIEHLKEYGKNFGGDLILDMVQGVVKRGKWTGFEIGFFDALGNYIAGNRIPISAKFDVVECAT